MFLVLFAKKAEKVHEKLGATLTLTLTLTLTAPHPMAFDEEC